MSTNGLLILSALLYAVWLAWYHKRPQIRKFKRPIGGYIGYYKIGDKFHPSVKVYLTAISNNIGATIEAYNKQARELMIGKIVTRSYQSVKMAYDRAVAHEDEKMASIYAEALERIDQNI